MYHEDAFACSQYTRVLKGKDINECPFASGGKVHQKEEKGESWEKGKVQLLAAYISHSKSQGEMSYDYIEGLSLTYSDIFFLIFSVILNDNSVSNLA